MGSVCFRGCVLVDVYGERSALDISIVPTNSGSTTIIGTAIKINYWERDEPTRGDITIDGVGHGYLNTYSSSFVSFCYDNSITISGLSSGQHTITITRNITPDTKSLYLKSFEYVGTSVYRRSPADVFVSVDIGSLLSPHHPLASPSPQ